MLQRLRAETSASHVSQPFGRVGDALVLLQPLRIGTADVAGELNRSAWAEIAPAAERSATNESTTQENERELDELLCRLREKNFLTGEQRVLRGGLAAALTMACAAKGNGLDVELTENEGADRVHALFEEAPGRAVVACRPSAHLALTNFVDRSARFTAEAIGRITDGTVRVRWMGETVLQVEARALMQQIRT